MDNTVSRPVDEDAHPYVGLVNQASTCYLNSLIQTLYMTPEFRNSLYRWEYTGGEERAKKNIAYQLQRLFLLLQSSAFKALHTNQLTTSFGWDQSDAWDQHDVQELYRKMFEALVKKWKTSDSEVSHIQRLYEGKLKDSIECLQCGTVSCKMDTFFELSLAVKCHDGSNTYNSLQDALRGFTQAELLDGRNQYFCSKCNAKQDASKKLDLIQLPYILTIQLKRFDFNYTTLHRIKLNDRIVFPEILDMNNLNNDGTTSETNHFLRQKLNHSIKSKIVLEKGESLYELFSIMVHSGSAGGGHYFAYIKNMDTGDWLCFNDEDITVADIHQLESTYGGVCGGSLYNYECSAGAYMLVYRKIDVDENEKFMNLLEIDTNLKETLSLLNEEEQKRQEEETRAQQNITVKYLRWHAGGGGGNESLLIQIPKSSSVKPLKQTIMENSRIPFNDEDNQRLIEVEHQSDSRFWIKRSLDDESLTLHTVFQDAPCVCLESKQKSQSFLPYDSKGNTYLIKSVDLQKGVQESGAFVWAPSNANLHDLRQIVAKKFSRLESEIRIVMRGKYDSVKLLDAPNRPLDADFEEYLRIRHIFVDLTQDLNGTWENDCSVPFSQSYLLKTIEAHIHAKSLRIVIPGKSTFRRASFVLPFKKNTDELQPVLEEEQEMRSDSSSPVDNSVTSDFIKNFEIESTQLLDNDDTMLDVKADQRMSLEVLKRHLGLYMQVPGDWFGLRKRMGSFEFDINDLNQLVETALGADRIVVKLECPLKPEENMVSFYKFDQHLQQDSWKKLFEIALTENIEWEELMKKVLKALRKYCGLESMEGRVKLREKRAGYLPCLHSLKDREQKWCNPLVIHIYKKEMQYNEISIFVRHWNPAELILGPVKQVNLDRFCDLTSLQWQLGQISRIPPHRIQLASLFPGRGGFPYESYRLTLLDEMKFSTEFDISLIKDGHVIFYKDARDEARSLTEEERKRIKILDKSKLDSSNRTRLRRERSLRIQSQQSSDVTDED